TATARRPWSAWHIFGAPEGDEPVEQAGPDSEQDTFWSGKPCMAERCTVVVGEASDESHWSRRFAGTERKAVMVKVGDDETFFIDDEGFELTDEEVALAKSRGQDIKSQIGSPGWGWNKVTVGLGSPQFGHADLPVDRIVSTAHDQSV
ncbi:MAG TPA: hypothetical protein VGV69_02755, partial [Solirubrobacterales bacterium]|nr:hypothetical protein [Solirubrobacterales bacterium]